MTWSPLLPDMDHLLDLLYFHEESGMSGLWTLILKACARISMRVGKVSARFFLFLSFFLLICIFFSKLEHALVFANSFNSLKFL